ncbi:Bug family tripartite tricarboxylate transporter substrate binding protein [Paucibacter sp. Y2R2-4]|uniref:Bug family tripartite tricarboxylate transporter substrate binding protein n=1 Tax=Paucibacter sp. Y2R2-4 TaxID=2893553 RepID=UPI0021E4D585|nr:tripartite tricarboxylate transporter substrate binding protein [Paucibacter sp. Y2R2-4]MCV2349783.1 tripartite tricarboxylate transporter substrate binding protein [Paucibacter sp. Y2R2-4]
MGDFSNSRRQLLLLGAGACALNSAEAQAWPSRPIKLLVPFPGGSSPDVVARALAEPLSKALGQAVVVDNRPGAGGNIGTGMAAKSPADGYTLLFTTQGPLVTAPLLNRRLPYEPVKDLQPISWIASAPNVLVADAKLGLRDVADLLRLARTRRGELNYGSVGNGSASHLAMEDMMRRAGIALTHVPFAGFPQVLNAMLSGLIQVAWMVPGQAMPQVRAGRLNALGVSSLGRMAALADLPTLAEQGFKGFEAISWQALLAPAGLPAPLLKRLSFEVQSIVRSDEFRARLLAQDFSVVGSSPEGLALHMAAERKRWAQVIQSAGVQAE